MKKAMLVITVIVFVAAAFAFVKVGMPLIRLSRGQQFDFHNVGTMAEASAHVVRAEILSATVKTEEFRRTAGDAQVVTGTIYTIRTLEVFQGELEVGEEIEMIQWWGGLIWDRNGLSIREGNDLILFLSFRSPASIFGVYRLPRSVSSDVELDSSIRLRPVRYRRLPGNGVRITVQDLWDLREN